MSGNIKKIGIVLLLFTQIIYYTNAQKQNNNWFFGENAALTWQTLTSYSAIGVHGTANDTLYNMPSRVTGSPMSTLEGCFAISDLDGNLLFFSDGRTIWNKNKGGMTNGSGLLGNPSSAQSGIVIPYPYSNTKYIALALGETSANNLSYSVIDMEQSNGLGAVTSPKNARFSGHSGTLGESVAATRHSNKYDYWIMAPGRNSNTTVNKSYLNVWKVTSAGVQATTPTVTEVPRVTNPGSPGGYVQFTQDGKHFAWICFEYSFFCYGDFDNTTGTVSNLKIRSGGLGVNTNGYGVCFTPDGKYLYLTYVPGTRNGNYYSGLEVYDFEELLAAPDPALVEPVKRLINPQSSVGSGANDHFGAIQSGSDGRMYIARFLSTGMFVIDNPEDPANMRIYKINNILSGRVVWGLPNFTAPWFMLNIELPSVPTSICAERASTYKLLIADGLGFDEIDKIELDFGDGKSDSKIIYNPPEAGVKTLNRTYKTPGIYTITATAYNYDGSVNVSTNTKVIVNSCALRVNPNVRGVNR